MSLKSELVGLLVSPRKNDSGENVFEKGTAYPIREGVVITAAHVIPEIEKYNDLEIKSSYILWPTMQGKYFIKSVLFYCSDDDVDIAVLKCETPSGFEGIKPRTKAVSPRSAYQSYGYPRCAALDQIAKIGQKSITGICTGEYHDKHIRDLKSDIYPEDDEWWQGVSGAPVFTIENPQLIGVLIRSSDTYLDEKDDKHQLYKGVLHAVFIDRLLKMPRFEKAFYGEKKEPDYHEVQEEKLRKLWSTTFILKEKFPTFDDLVQQFKAGHSDCIGELATQFSEGVQDEDIDKLRKLLSLLLSQVDILGCEDKAEDHIYALKVATALLSEVAIARIHGAEPSFKASKTGLARLQGEGVFPPSLVETGFDNLSPGKEAAHVVSHAVYKQFHNKQLVDIHSDSAVKLYKDLDIILSKELKKKRLHRYELDTSDPEYKNHPLMSEETRKYLKENLLPNLLIAFYGEEKAFDDESSLGYEVGEYMKNLKS